jgi:hypothetical protein
MKIVGHGSCQRVESAFSLIEAVVGATMVTILFVSLYAGMSEGFAVTKVARENLRATQIMLERMEGIRLYNWDQLVSSNMIPLNFTSYYYPLASAGQSHGIPYVGTFAISNVNFPSPAPSYANDMRLITVRIWWTNSLGTSQVARSRQMQSLVGRLGVQNYVYNN